MSKTIRELVILCVLMVWVDSKCCLSFKEGSCVECPPGMHLYRSNCLFDIVNCIEYHLGFDCLRCKQGYSLTNGSCLHPRICFAIQVLTFRNKSWVLSLPISTQLSSPTLSSRRPNIIFGQIFSCG
jgi:hypothetical protein